MKIFIRLLVVLCISPVICNVIHISPDIDHALCIEHPCLTLSQLSSRLDLLSKLNVTIKLISENHILTNQFLATNINHLEMSSSRAVTITCQESGRLTVKSVNHVIFRGIIFKRCSDIRFMIIIDLRLSDLIFYSQGMDSVIKLINSTLTTVINSSFIGNVTHNHHNVISGGALIALNSTVTIRECSFINNSARIGGAIHATRGTKLMVLSSTLFNNTADHGGAISIEQSNVTLEGCIRHNNTAQSNAGNGGAIVIHGRATVVITNTSISNNTAVSGGGLFTSDCEVFISHNRAVKSGGALYCSKNSIITSNIVIINIISDSASTNNHYCNVYIKNNSRIINNHALNNGGGLCIEGRFLSLERSHISDNLASYGGGVYGSNCHMVFSDSIFTSNTAVLGGGAMCLKESHPIEINNSTFSSNRVKYGRGAAIQSQSVFIKLVQCTVNNNTATECGAVDANMVEIIDSTFGFNTAFGRDEVGGGGALCVWNGYTRVEGTLFEGNEAVKDGGVMIISNTDLRMHNSHFVNNNLKHTGLEE